MWADRQSFGERGAVEPSVPHGDHDVVVGGESAGEVDGFGAAKIVSAGELAGALLDLAGELYWPYRSPELSHPFGGDSPENKLMPDVVCMNLQDAQNEIQDHGVFLSRSQDASGEGRLLTHSEHNLFEPEATVTIKHRTVDFAT